MEIMSTSELMDTAFEVLTELQRRYNTKTPNIVFRQSKRAVVKKDGIPADRKGWLYLPFFAKLSKVFQPKEDEVGKLYSLPVPHGTELEMAGEKFVVDNTARETVALSAEGAFIKGNIIKLRC